MKEKDVYSANAADPRTNGGYTGQSRQNNSFDQGYFNQTVYRSADDYLQQIKESFEHEQKMSKLMSLDADPSDLGKYITFIGTV